MSRLQFSVVASAPTTNASIYNTLLSISPALLFPADSKYSALYMDSDSAQQQRCTPNIIEIIISNPALAALVPLSSAEQAIYSQQLMTLFGPDVIQIYISVCIVCHCSFSFLPQFIMFSVFIQSYPGSVVFRLSSPCRVHRVGAAVAMTSC
jgi:hypothetical protein